MGEPNLTCPRLIERHYKETICKKDLIEVNIDVCDERSNITNLYFCTIFDATLLPILTAPIDAYIEWHWRAEYVFQVPHPPPLIPRQNRTVTGKFIFAATGKYIANQFLLYGWNGFSGSGIGMFNPSNHNGQI